MNYEKPVQREAGEFDISDPGKFGMGDAGFRFRIAGGKPLFVQRFHDPARKRCLCPFEIGIGKAKIAKGVFTAMKRIRQNV